MCLGGGGSRAPIYITKDYPTPPTPTIPTPEPPPPQPEPENQSAQPVPQGSKKETNKDKLTTSKQGGYTGTTGAGTSGQVNY